MLKIKESNSDWNKTYQSYRDVGGVLYIYPFQKIDFNKDLYYAHKEVAAFTTHLVETELYNLPKSYVDVSRFEYMEGEIISIEQFLGPGYDLNTDNLVLDSISTNSVIGSAAVGGFVSAFMDPPYPLECSMEDSVVLFHKINSEILGYENKTENSIIYQWDTSYSRFFDKGKIWWGSYLWSVYNKKLDQYFGIAASETD